MKKQLIAAAVASAFAVPAMAQNMTITGVIDTMIQSYDSGTERLTRSNDHGLGTSRIVFSGTEDLGGGQSAYFVYDMRVNPSAGTNASATTGINFNRGAYIGLKGGFGAIELGTNDTTATQDIDSKVSQAANIALRSSIGTGAAAASGELGSDVANVVRYKSPNINGVSFELGYANANGSSAVADANSGNIADVFVQYESGPLGVYFGKTQKDAATAAAETDFMAFGVKYDFGTFSVGYTGSSADTDTGANKTKTNVLSAKMPLGGGLALQGVYANASIENTSNKGSGVTVALTKALSKRTTVYGAYTSTESKGGRYAMPLVTSPAADTTADASALSVGISHSF